ncbi:MAG: M23 family metallopeptidase [Cyanobacteria bacterium J06641_5]
MTLAASAIAPGVRANDRTVAAARFPGGSWSQASFPVENFQAYTSPFGYRKSPTSGRWSLHRGIDIAAPFGSTIRNWWAGEVVGLTNDPLCGTTVRVKSGDWEHVYCHLRGRVETLGGRTILHDRQSGSQIFLGQVLPTGAALGSIGMTGRTTGPHLHWGLRYGGELVDPATVLRAMSQQRAAGVPATAVR